MSIAYLLAAKEDGELDCIAEYGNSWGYQPFVWDALADKYIENIRDLGPFRKWDALFDKMWSGLQVRPWELNVFIMSFDEFYVHGREDVEVWIESLKRFEDAYRVANRICHLGSIITDLKKALDDGYEYFAWHGSSLNSNVWQIPIGDPKDDDWDGEMRPYNIKTDADATLYDRLVAKAQQVRPRPLSQEWATLKET